MRCCEVPSACVRAARNAEEDEIEEALAAIGRAENAAVPEQPHVPLTPVGNVVLHVERFIVGLFASLVPSWQPPVAAPAPVAAPPAQAVMQ
jgi:hypothetical protein